MRRLLAVQILCLALACSSGGSNNDAAGSAGSGATAGTGGSGSGSAGTTGTAGNSGTTGSAGRGGAAAPRERAEAGGIKCLAFDAPGLVRGLACPNTTPPCYAACDFDGDQYVGCISGSTDFTECFPSCGACP